MRKKFFLLLTVALYAYPFHYALASAISGSVMDAASGEPVRNARVDAIVTTTDSDGLAIIQSTNTNREGSFLLAGLADGSYRIVVAPPDRYMHHYRHFGDVAVAGQDVALGVISLERHPFVITSVKVGKNGVVATVLNNTDKSDNLVFWANVSLGYADCAISTSDDSLLPDSCELPYLSEITLTRRPVEFTMQPGNNVVKLSYQVPAPMPGSDTEWFPLGDIPKITIYGGHSMFKAAMHPRSGYLY